ncbi:Sodium-dependent phosphate transporter [Operophtera brumata]|uniref:Sodium-dependent phosphate transporter n=1 Tax=Operophtera brumata TaxID=104452 RepID=A0A0L7L138_OPEBR|nr:Sodium-dependent phosphate transporter [Operophtera brumata]
MSMKGYINDSCGLVALSNKHTAAVIVIVSVGGALGVRHVQVLMLFLAMLLSFAMRVNMSMAIVAMTDTTNENVCTHILLSKSVSLVPLTVRVGQ